MKKYLDKLPAEIKSLLRLAQMISAKNNVRAWLVGGVVRDLILGVHNFDLDIVVEGEGIKFAKGLAVFLKARITKHQRFGTATIFLEDNQKIDIATARKEIYPYPASLPVVASGTLRDDLFRRDFTINAMAQDIGVKDFGALLDLFGGRKDILDKKIRILHDLSFIDDPTRILRAIRFEQRYNFRIEPATLRALKAAAAQEMLNKAGPQRLRDEIILLLKEADPLKQIRRMQGLAGLSFIHPKLHTSKKTYALMLSLNKEIGWFRQACLSGRQARLRKLDAWLIYLMAVLDSLDVNQTRQALRRFAFRKGEEKRILSYKKVSRSFIHKLSQDGLRPSQVFGLLMPLSYEVIIMIKAKFKHKNLQKNIADFFDIYNGTRLHVCGDDLRGMGIQPGPCYQKILDRALKAKLDGLVKTKEEELTLINKLRGRL